MLIVVQSSVRKEKKRGFAQQFQTSLGDCRNSFFVFVSDRSRSGLAENLGQIRL
jgi:hypothetical protein